MKQTSLSRDAKSRLFFKTVSNTWHWCSSCREAVHWERNKPFYRAVTCKEKYLHLEFEVRRMHLVALHLRSSHSVAIMEMHTLKDT